MTKIYLIFGKQGSGKTTQGKRFAEHLKIPYLEAGESLRKLSTRDTQEGRHIKEVLRKGALAPNYILRFIFDEFIETNNCLESGFVTDGFPRTLAQIELLEEFVSKYQWQVIGLDIIISDETAKQRLASRVTEINGKQVRRDDDKPEIVEKRLENYQKVTVPVIDWVREHCQLIEIDGEQSPDEVTKDITEKIL